VCDKHKDEDHTLLGDSSQVYLLSLASSFSLPTMEENKQNQVARIQDFDPPKKPKTNKYAIACTFLASLSSILLGYGNYFHFLPSYYILLHLLPMYSN